MADVVGILAKASYEYDCLRSPGFHKPRPRWGLAGIKTKRIRKEIAKAQLAALESAGHQVVPVTPTGAMMDAGAREFDLKIHPILIVGNIYKAMLRAQE